MRTLHAPRCAPKESQSCSPDGRRSQHPRVGKEPKANAENVSNRAGRRGCRARLRTAGRERMLDRMPMTWLTRCCAAGLSEVPFGTPKPGYFAAAVGSCGCSNKGAMRTMPLHVASRAEPRQA